ncbi:hypothetical protein O6H91_03G048500 [Diphasiastrum complanatum]|uniref:Uncharacterized protein n=1 Tax=Diphasiastrum complanatum TaxID=34168 RepID=A0ACC2E624_DIPCM|nr:hypothetical protein O6H91_03G048500 [Diphasiastrum complanatum]
MPFILSLRDGPAFVVRTQMSHCGWAPSARGATSFAPLSRPATTHGWLSSQICNRSFCEQSISRVSLKPIRPNHILTMGYAMDATVGDDADEIPGPPPVFPRIYVRDPYKLLGISHDASEMEVQEARTYLMNEYGRHERSREAIDAAHDKIIFASYRERKRSKINLKSNLKKKLSESPVWVQKLANLIEVPTSTIIMRRAALFALLAIWSIMKSAEGGPAFQVAVSLGLCIYFINDRVKSLGRAAILGLGSLVVGWLFGSFVVPALPTYLLPRSWSLELLTALISYVCLWFACTFLK